MRKAILLGLPVLFVCSALPVWAQSTYVVDRLTDTGEGAALNGDLRYCITNATSGLDTITFGVTGTINLTRALPDLATSVAIAGPGADRLTVRRTTGGGYRIFTLTGIPTVLISGLTIANGIAAQGGGIYVADGNLILTNSILSENIAVDCCSSARGGGIYVARGTVSVDKSTLFRNFAYGQGGGIYVADGNLTLTNSVVSINTSLDGGLGGGAYVASGTVSVDNTTLSNNDARGSPGADGGCGTFICFDGGSGGLGRGGGIYVAGGAMSVTNSTLSSNQAAGGDGGSSVDGFGSGASGGWGGLGQGGGIYVAGGTLRVFQNTLSGNRSSGGNGGNGFPGGNGGDGSGGGLFISGGNVEVQHSTLSANQSTGGAGAFDGFAGQGNGGGLVFTAGTLRTRNTILARNMATISPDISGNLGSLGHNLIGNSTGGSGFDATDLLNVDAMLGPLQDNGGPTFTHALLPGSPAIDAGDNTGAPDWDQRGPGFRRIDIGTWLIDIGAFEVQ